MFTYCFYFLYTLVEASQYLLYPSEAHFALWGNISELDHLFINEVQKEDDIGQYYNISMKDLDDYLNDYVSVPVKPLRIEGMDFDDVKEFNKLSDEVQDLRRRESDWEDLTYMEGHKKWKMSMIGLQFLFHTRHKIALGLEQRLPIRTDKRYRLGYIFNRLRRLKIEMIKLLAVGKLLDKEKTNAHLSRHILTAVRIYERIIKYDTDIKDTMRYIQFIYEEESPVDYEFIDYENLNTTKANATRPHHGPKPPGSPPGKESPPGPGGPSGPGGPAVPGGPPPGPGPESIPPGPLPDSIPPRPGGR